MSTSAENLVWENRTGKHSPAEWVRLLFALQAEGFSGELLLRNASQTRRFLVLRGHLMDFRSSHRDEELAKTLIKAKLVDPQAFLDLNDQQAELTLAEEGLLSQEALESHFETRLEMGIVAGLMQNTGSWEAQPKPALDSVEVSKALYPKLDLWNVLWSGVKTHLPSKDLVLWAGKEGRLFRRSLQLALPYVEAANSQFLKDCSDCETLEDFLQSTNQDEATLWRIWILSAAGIFELFDAADAPKRDEVPPRIKSLDSTPAMSRAPLPTMPKPTGNQAQDISAEYTQRMGKDYYGFLGLPPNASAVDLRDLSRSLAQRLNALSRAPSLPQESQELVQDMLSGVQRVYGTFTDRKRKEDYDRQLELGDAATIVPRGKGP